MMNTALQTRARQAVATRFAKLLERTEPTVAEIAAYSSHRDSIQTALRAGLDDRVRVFAIGSASRNSGLRSFSDLDVMAKLPIDLVRRGSGFVSSDTTIKHVRAALSTTFPRTEIGKDEQAIVVQFAAGSRSVDVVPAVWLESIAVPALGRQRPVFAIPDGNGGWLPTSPAAHGDYITREDERARWKLGPTARLVKFWRYCRAQHVPLQSFHVELVLAQEGICTGPRSYSSCLTAAFTTLAHRSGTALVDPLGISPAIPAASTAAKRKGCRRALHHAAEHACKAFDAELQGDFQEAWRQWNIVFNGQFPR